MAEIDTRTEDGILHLRVLGTLFKKDLGDFIKNYLSLVESSGCRKVLVDMTGVNYAESYERSLFTENYMMIQEYRPFVPNVYTAVIENEQYAYLVDFKVQVFRLIGYDRIAYFFDCGEALAWLKGQGA